MDLIILDLRTLNIYCYNISITLEKDRSITCRNCFYNLTFALSITVFGAIMITAIKVTHDLWSWCHFTRSYTESHWWVPISSRLTGFVLWPITVYWNFPWGGCASYAVIVSFRSKEIELALLHSKHHCYVLQNYIHVVTLYLTCSTVFANICLFMPPIL